MMRSILRVLFGAQMAAGMLFCVMVHGLYAGDYWMAAISFVAFLMAMVVSLTTGARWVWKK